MAQTTIGREDQKPAHPEGPRDDTTPKKKNKRAGKLPPGYQRRTLLVLLFPAILLELAVYVAPIGAGIFTAFTRVNQFSIRNWFSAPFVGLQNFTSVLSSPVVAKPIIHSFLVSVEYVLFVVGISLILGFMAMVFVRSLRRGRFFQIFFIVPYAIPVYAGVLAWDFSFQGGGAINRIFGEHTLWLQGNHAFFAMVIAAVWRTWPFVFLMMLAASSNIPSELFEAIQVDGGGRWAETRHIIFPHVQSQLGVLALLLAVWNFNDFVTPFVYFGQVAPPAANVFPLSVYVTTFVSFSYSIGAAVTILSVIILSVFVVWPYMKITKLGDV